MTREEVVTVCRLTAVRAATDVNPEPFSHGSYFIDQVADDDGAWFTVCIIKSEKE